MKIRPLDPRATAEVHLVAGRMRDTLVEVLGEETGGAMYTHEWLVQRVLWHLDPDATVGQVFVAETDAGEIAGHTILRIEPDDDGLEMGLFSTIFVEPGSRKRGLAAGLLARGERWMVEHGLTKAVTYTDEDNAPLQKLFEGHGYTMTRAPNRFVRLSKQLLRANV